MGKGISHHIPLAIQASEQQTPPFLPFCLGPHGQGCQQPFPPVCLLPKIRSPHTFLPSFFSSSQSFPHHTLTSDCSSQFTSSLWFHNSSLLNMTHITTSVHPQSKDMVKRFHLSAQATLCARYNTLNWSFLGFSFPSAPYHMTLPTSPAEAMYGTPHIITAQFPAVPEDISSYFLSTLHSSLSGSLTSSSPLPRLHPKFLLPSFTPKAALSKPLLLILLCSPPAYLGPFQVFSCMGTVPLVGHCKV